MLLREKTSSQYVIEFQSVGQSRKKSLSEGIRMPRLKVSQKRETFRDHNSRSVRKSLLAEWVDISIKIAGAAVYDVSIPYGTA